MEQLAPPGTVRLTAETVRFAEGYVEVRWLGPIPVKGLADPIEIFELTGAGSARTRLQAAALRGLTRFVGRDAEVEHLRRVLGQAGAGRGQVVAIVGEAGVGKSRLTYEFTHSHRVQDWLILEASSVSYGKATSYLPVIDLLKGYFKIGDRDDHREMRAKVLGRVLGLDRALEPLLPRCSRCSTCRSRTRPGRIWTRSSAPSARLTRSSACCCGRAGGNRCSWFSRTCTGSTARPRPCWIAWWRAWGPPTSCSW